MKISLLSVTPTWTRRAAAVIATSLVLGGQIASMPIAVATSIQSQQHGWNATLHVARLSEEHKLVMQLDVHNKPFTRYANAVYQVFAKQNNQWVEVYTTTGARLAQKMAGNVTLSPEVIDCNEIERKLNRRVDWNNLELKTVVQVRYDLNEQQRDQVITYEQQHRYASLMQTSSTLIASQSTYQTVSTSSTGTPQPIPTVLTTQPVTQRSSFSLSIAQTQSIHSKVTARVSIKQRQSNGSYASERWIGDYRYKVKKNKKNTIRCNEGIFAGDRVVVRLFDSKNRFVGYSEFEVLEQNTAVALVLPNHPNDYGIVRTVYGLDVNQDLTFDQRAGIFDYFTQISTTQNYLNTQVTFFRSTQSIQVSRYMVSGLSAAPRDCSYPTSFLTGSFAVVSQLVYAFSSSLSTQITTLPTQVLEVSEGNRQVLVSDRDNDCDDDCDDRDKERVRERDDDDGKRRKFKKRHCNQGRGNGAEGCDPGNSRPHGGSNDEGRSAKKNRR